MWKDMFAPQVPLAESALRIVLVYALVAATRAVRWLVDSSSVAQRLLEGRPTTVIEDGRVGVDAPAPSSKIRRRPAGRT